jgi:hypothetical protein
MTIEKILNLFEYHNFIEIECDEDGVKLILQIDDFKDFYSLIDKYMIDNEIYLKALSETFFSLNITDILTFYGIDKDCLISKIEDNRSKNGL